MAVDVDHLPLVPRHREMRKHMPRPPLHTLLTPAAVAAGALLARGRAREAALGFAAGTCVHFLRDAATGTGMAPLQPLSKRRGRAPYAIYAAVVGLLAARAWNSRYALRRPIAVAVPR